MTNYVAYFGFLDALREFGVTNMFGARPYLEEEFGLSKAEAAKVLTSWMRTFGDAAERAALVAP